MDRRVAVRVRGQVQGVFFRVEARARAASLGLSGFVRNDEDGTVYLEAEGGQDQVGELVSWCRVGPSYAQVDSLEVSEQTPRGETGFVIEY